MIVTKANIIYENVLSVNVTKGERKVSLLNLKTKYFFFVQVF